MPNSEYIILGLTALLPVIVSGIIFHAQRKLAGRLSYRAQQVVIGILFGVLAILLNECGVRIEEGLVVNCRDAAVLSAGLLFGGPAGIIAGIIGGIERFISVAWGNGAYSQIACSVSTILAGFFAAAIRRFPLDGTRPNWAIAFLSGVVMEAFHSIMVVVTHLDDIPNALQMIIYLVPMLFVCSLSIMLASITVNILAQGGAKNTPQDQSSIRQVFQNRILVATITAFALFSGFGFAAETIVCSTANREYLEQNLRATKELNLDSIVSASTPSSDGTTFYTKMGDTGYILLSRITDGTIVSAPAALYGKSMSDIGLGQAEQTNPNPLTESASDCSSLYSATVKGTACECMDSFSGPYRLTAVYPVEEGYLDRDRTFTLTVLLQILLFAVIFALSDIIIYRNVVRPMRGINESLQEITDGNLNTVVNVRSNREFAQLSDGFNTTVAALQQYTNQAKERIESELQLAHDIQHATLPKVFPPYPDRREFDIFGCMNTAKEVGGDFYDFFLTDQNTLKFLIADVSDKGIPAAMFMMRAKTKLKDLAETGIALDQVIAKTNAHLCEDNQSNMFVTLWCGSLDVSTGIVTYVNAGHNAPLVRHRDGTVEFVEGKHNFVLGAFENSPYTCHTLQLQAGDILYLYTDGVTEATTENNVLFGNDRLVSTLTAARPCSLKELCSLVQADLDAFAQGAPQADDITMLAVQYNGCSGDNGCSEDSLNPQANN